MVIIMERYQKTIAVAALMLVFSAWFVRNTSHDLPLVFQKDLLAHDESSNSVVAANVTRKFFPPMVRVNPLATEQGNWMEGPYWQHIPPLFAYVPYLFFQLDGQVTIEVKRLSYAFVTLLTGLLFIFSVYKYRESLLAALAGTAAAIFWVNTPFPHELITGYAFGASDIVLAFTVVCAFAGIIWYLRDGITLSADRQKVLYDTLKLGLIGMVVALPIMAKNLLGAIPAATYFILLIWDSTILFRRGTAASDSSPRIGEVRRGRFLVSASSFIGILALYFLPLYFASPQTFKNEIIVSFLHLQNLEGWGRPWHWYLSNYLPQRYLLGWTWVYYAGLIFALIYNIKAKVRITSRVALVWFVWNLVAISLVTSKVPNFIYQSYLLSLYAIVYSLFVFARSMTTKQSGLWVRLPRLASEARRFAIVLLAFIFLVTGYEGVRFAQAFYAERASAYNYQTEHERFYQLAERLRDTGLNTEDLVIINNPPNDCWERYYVLFLTGSESKTLLEMNFNTLTYSSINQKYRAVYFVDPSFVIKKIQSEELKGILDANAASIQQDIARIKKDKTSCQWLVPDAILNAP